VTQFPDSKIPEPSPRALAAFGEIVDAFGALTREQQAIVAHEWRQKAVDSEQREDRQRKPRLKTVLDQAKKAGATAATVEGVTYTFDEASPSEAPSTGLTADDELARWRRKHAR
jgi:hypothetical protein